MNPERLRFLAAEAELHAATRVLSEAMMEKPFGRDSGEEVRICVLVDAEATQWLSHRAGLGKAGHIETAGCWRQNAQEPQELELAKVGPTL